MKLCILLDSQWHGFIKEYDGGTLMEFVIHDGLPYTRFPEMIRSQRQALDSRIRKLSNSHLVYPGLQIFQREPRPVLEPQDIPGERHLSVTSCDTTSVTCSRYMLSSVPL